MQIKKKLQMNVAVSAVTAVIICFMFLMTMHRISQAMEVAVIADKIIIKIFERGTFGEDYLRTGSERAKTQWLDRQEQIGELLKSAAEKFKGTERRKKIVAELNRNHDTAAKLFSAIVKNREKSRSDADSSEFSHEVESRLLTQLNLRLYDDTLQAGRLQELGYGLMLASLKKSGGGIAGVLAIVITASLISSWMMSRVITKRVRTLRDGSAIIGGGDLDHRINMEGDDEFTEISGAFNAMTAKLRGTYNDLGKEIAERKHTEEALRQKEERLRLAMAAARMASWDWNVLSGEVVWNDAHFRMMGYEPGEVQPSYDAWADRVHPEDRVTAQNLIKQCMAEGSLYTAEFRTLWPDGTVRWLEARGDFEYDAGNRPLRNYGVMLDITERKRTEEKLRQAKEEWELTFNSVPDLIAIIDEQHRVVRVNRAMAKRLGREPEECVGVPCYEAIHDSNLPPEFCPHSRTMVDGCEHNLELRGERLGGDFLVTTTPLLDREGKMTGSVHVARDITERKRAEVALKRAYEEMEKRVEERTAELRDKDQMLLLQSRQAAMGEMIGNIAHQWRQPLNFLGLTIQQLPLYYDLGKINRELLDQCVSSSMEVIQHMSRTIDDFRNYFRPDKEKTKFNVHDAIVNALSLLEGTLQNPRIDITIVVKDDPVIYGYQNEFSQVLLNILMNARDALLERNVADPRVSITICCENGCSVVTIADSAGGIPEDIIDKVFDPYFTTKGPQQGTGVGLFMSKTIIEKNMGGRLSVRNRAGGAEFRIEVGNDNTI